VPAGRRSRLVRDQPSRFRRYGFDSGLTNSRDRPRVHLRLAVCVYDARLQPLRRDVACETRSGGPTAVVDGVDLASQCRRGRRARGGGARTRAEELQAALPEGLRGRVTMGVGVGRDAAGNVGTVVGTSEPGGIYGRACCSDRARNLRRVPVTRSRAAWSTCSSTGSSRSRSRLVGRSVPHVPKRSAVPERDRVVR
jgi:hypothetical protein